MIDDGYDATTDFVRVGVKSGGCSGLSYDLKFDKEEQEGDKIFIDNGVKLIIDKKSFLYFIIPIILLLFISCYILLQNFFSNQLFMNTILSKVIVVLALLTFLFLQTFVYVVLKQISFDKIIENIKKPKHA